jgi:hypothetical protein
MSRRPRECRHPGCVEPGGVTCLGPVSSSPRCEPIIGPYPGLLTGFWPLQERSDLHDGGCGHSRLNTERPNTCLRHSRDNA